VVMLAGGVGRPLLAQRALNPNGTRTLNFGNIFPGVRTTVLRTDAAAAGRFNLTGANRLEVRITFTLPAALTASGGRTMPLQFAAGDGGFALTNTIAAATAFDPRVALVTRLSNRGRLFIWMGGTALPTPTQRAGTYTATIILTAAYTGN
jgi:hypothetical protein